MFQRSTAAALSRLVAIAFLAAASLVSFAGCKKGGGSDAVAKMSDFKDKMCACKDKACVDQVSSDMARWSSGRKRRPATSSIARTATPRRTS